MYTYVLLQSCSIVAFAGIAESALFYWVHICDCIHPYSIYTCVCIQCVYFFRLNADIAKGFLSIFFLLGKKGQKTSFSIWFFPGRQRNTEKGVTTDWLYIPRTIRLMLPQPLDQDLLPSLTVCRMWWMEQLDIRGAGWMERKRPKRLFRSSMLSTGKAAAGWMAECFPVSHSLTKWPHNLLNVDGWGTFSGVNLLHFYFESSA